jgi:hypothetical protein
MDFNCCFFIVSIVLISGHGSFLISGYNTAKKEEKESLMKKSFAEPMELVFLLFLFLFC